MKYNVNRPKEFKMASKKDNRCKCMICGEVKATQNAMLYHLRTQHNEKMRKGTTWNYCTLTKKKKAKKKTKKQHLNIPTSKIPTITPSTKYIEIQAVLRIPISIGQVEIIAAE